MRQGLLVAALVIFAALGWGWWHARTHGTLHVSIHDLSQADDRQSWADVRSAEIAFLDGEGRVLATGHVDEPYSVHYARHPQAGDCKREERGDREAWQRCFRAQSEWLTTWVPRTRSAQVTVGACTIARVPVTLAAYEEWWLWWVPLPHVGGKPYTSFDLSLRVNVRTCSPA